MTQTRWALVVLLGGAALAAVVLPPIFLVELLVVAAVAAFACLAPPAVLLAVPFFVVQVLGEAFQVGGPLAATQMSFALVIAGAVRAGWRSLPAGPGRIDRALAAWLLTVTVFLAFGLATGSRLAAAKEDLVPIVILAFTYVGARLIVRDERSTETVLTIILAGTFIAALKSVYLFAAPTSAGWDSPWQAARIEGAGATRVMLRGADIFFVVASLLVLGRLIIGRVARFAELFVGLLSVAGMVIAGTRSNWMGWAVGAAVLVTTGSALRMTRPRRALMAFALAAAVFVGVYVSSPQVRGWAGTQLSAAQSRGYTIDFRANENAGVLAEIRNTAWLGGGFGRSYTFWDLEQGRFVATTWSHNAFLEIVLKTGLLGLAVFLFLMGRGCVMALQVALRRAHVAGIFLGLSGAMVAVLVLSLAANKIFESTGGMFLGLALALTQAAASEPVE
jgi:hypothetical protein